MSLRERLGVSTAYQDQEPEPLTQTSAEGGAIVPPVDIASGLGGGGENFYSSQPSEGEESEGADIMRALERVRPEDVPGLDTIIEMYVPESELPVPEPRVPKPATLKNRFASLFGRGKVAPVDVALQRHKKAQAAGVR